MRRLKVGFDWQLTFSLLQGPIRARLHQILSSEQAPRRDLDLRLGFLRILKHDKKLSSISNPTVDGQADSSWFTEEKRFSSIVALPPTVRRRLCIPYPLRVTLTLSSLWAASVDEHAVAGRSCSHNQLRLPHHL